VVFFDDWKLIEHLKLKITIAYLAKNHNFKLALVRSWNWHMLSITSPIYLYPYREFCLANNWSWTLKCFPATTYCTLSLVYHPANSGACIHVI